MNSSVFEIQRSSDAKTWNIVGMVAAQGESSSTANYSFANTNPSSGTNYYRLKMIDKDATFALSRIEKITVSSLSGNYLYPNPASELIQVKSQNWDAVKEIQIFNQNGQQIYHSGTKPVTYLSTSQLNNGVYSVKIRRQDGTTSVQKIVIIK